MAQSDVLDLCVRNKRPATPEMYTSLKKPSMYISSPTYEYSRLSNSDSETSDISADKLYNPLAKVKPTRPFKAYLKDWSTLRIAAADTTFGSTSSEAFAEFREKVMSQVQTNNNGTNKNMRRVPQNMQKQIDDPSYWEKRKKNNEAAKRSRDARRAKEDEIAIRCAFLEQENLQLKFKIASLEQRLHDFIYQAP